MHASSQPTVCIVLLKIVQNRHINTQVLFCRCLNMRRGNEEAIQGALRTLWWEADRAPRSQVSLATRGHSAEAFRCWLWGQCLVILLTGRQRI